MAPCVPIAHEALRYAANCDPDHSTRHWARKALSKIGNRCTAACTVCGPAPAEVILPDEPSLQGPVVPSTVVPTDPAPPESEPRLLAPITGLRRREVPTEGDRDDAPPALARRSDSSRTRRLVGRPLRLLRSSNLAPLLLGRDRDGEDR